MAVLREEYAKGSGYAARVHARLPHRSQPACAVMASVSGVTSARVQAPAAPSLPPLPVIESSSVIVAWRVWRAVTNGREAVLRSLWTGSCWLAGEAFATTNIVQHQKSDGGLRNGVHAFKSLPTIKAYGYDLPKDLNETLVHGTVALWGRVIEHERGYRAEFAYPQFICACTGEDLARAVARSYGIEVARCAAAPLREFPRSVGA